MSTRFARPASTQRQPVQRLAGRLAPWIGALILAACGGDDDTAAEKLAFKAPTLVSQPGTLSGDSGSGRCPDPGQICFKDNLDVMSGQHQLFRVDDLGLVVHTRSDAGLDRVEALGFLTTNSAISEEVVDRTVAPTPVTGAGPFVPRSAAIAARMTPEARDRYVFAVWDGAKLFVDIPLTNAAFANDESDNADGRLWMAAGDFTGDGLQDVVLVNGGRLRVLPVTAAADGTPQAFDTRGPALLMNGDDRPTALAVGDFFGSGAMIVTATMPPSARPLAPPRLNFYGVDPQSLAITLAQSLDLHVDAGIDVLPFAVALAAGRFASAQKDQLVVAVPVVLADKTQTIALFTVGADAQGNPVQRATVPGFIKAPDTIGLLMRHGRIDAASGLEAIAMLSSGSDEQQIVLASFDADLNPILEAEQSVQSEVCIRDMQLGNFDRQRSDPTRPNQGFLIRDPNLQLAFAISPDFDCTGLVIASQFIFIDDQQPAGKRLSLSPLLPIYAPVWNEDFGLQYAHLVAYDRQGRSMVLGKPDVVTIESQAQISVALGAPPMHVDLFGGQVFNVSAAPGGYFSNFESGSNDKVTNTSSWKSTYSFAAEESVSGGYTEGNCELGDCVSVDDKFSARQAVDGSSKQLSGSFSQMTTDLSEQTGLSDLIHYKQSALTLYVYPVLGRTVCPASKPGCAAADKVPMTMTVAGPDTTVETHVDGSQIPWYQPAWMPGNMLSYPGTLAQLRAAAWQDPTTFAPLSDPVRWQTDGSTTVEHTRWTSGGSSGTTTKLNQNYSFENDLSITGQVNAIVASGHVGVALDVSGSFGFQRLTDSESQTSHSTGIGFTKRAGFADPARYAYWVTPHIFGQVPPPGAAGDAAPDATPQLWGALRNSYVVDPLSSGAGALWRQQYTLPDIALNHPSRWVVTVLNADRNDGSCLIFDRATSDVQCASLADKDPADPWADEYHFMRGFFVGAASANGAGPQLSVATAGDALLLQVRVHNFSFAPMPPGTTVRVRVHAMEWDTGTNRRIGNSFVVGTASAPRPVAPFNIDTDQPNWLLVGVPFDTTPFAGKDLVFGAVVWMEDGSGRLVAEMDGKGLTSIPDASVDFVDLSGLEQAHGNNVGFFNSVLHIDAGQGAAQQNAGAAATRPSVVIDRVGVERVTVGRGQRTLVGVRVQVGETDLRGGLSADFYAGDPAAGGRRFGVQRLERLRAGRSYDFRTGYRSNTCGSQDLYVVVGRGTRFEHAARIETVTVSCG